MLINIAQCHLRVNDADKQIAFLKNTFEAKERKRFKLLDGSIIHAETRLGDSVIILSGARRFHLFGDWRLLLFKTPYKSGCNWVIETLTRVINNKPNCKG
jgi:uncharacterized glyoxalase superfamily protein PhnB